MLHVLYASRCAACVVAWCGTCVVDLTVCSVQHFAHSVCHEVIAENSVDEISQLVASHQVSTLSATICMACAATACQQSSVWPPTAVASWMSLSLCLSLCLFVSLCTIVVSLYCRCVSLCYRCVCLCCAVCVSLYYCCVSLCHPCVSVLCLSLCTIVVDECACAAETSTHDGNRISS